MDINQKGLKDFMTLCLKVKDEKNMTQLFDLFFTHEEKLDLAKRFYIVKALLTGDKTQRHLAKELDVSIAKITRGSNELKRMDKRFLTFLMKQF